MRVLVSHSGIQHSFQLANALDKAGYLACYCTGFPLRLPMQSRWFGSQRLAAFLRITNIPRKLRWHFVIFPLMAKVADKIFPQRISHTFRHRLDYIFDCVVALLTIFVRPDVIICYENSARLTFYIGRKLGALCILDAASVHPDMQKALVSERDKWDPEWIVKRKYKEISLAHHVICYSSFSAESYIAHVPNGCVHIVPLGAHLPFKADISYSPNRFSNGIKFVFVGSARFIKGVDLLVRVFDSILRDGYRASLTFVGGIIDPDVVDCVRRGGQILHQPNLPQTKLFEFLVDYDCLVLPSRFDAFPMVVAECMALGLPAIVSDRVGSKCIIEENPGSGWIVPFDFNSLRNQIIALIKDPKLIQSASIRAKIAAKNYTWELYHRRMLKVIRYAYDHHTCCNTRSLN